MGQAVCVCAETAVASVSSEMIEQLDKLMVEGDLLQVDVDDQQSLYQLLVACDADKYSYTVFQFEVFSFFSYGVKA